MKKIFFLLIIPTVFLFVKEHQTKDKTVTKIEQYLDSIEGFSGAVLIAKNDAVLFKKAYGYAHIGHKVKNDANTKFNQGSIGKTFTALSILQLAEGEKLTLKDKVGKYLPDYPNSMVRDSVTIFHLLTHTSGMPHYFAQDEFLRSSKDLFRTMDDLRDLYEKNPLESIPGKQFSYRNTNYLLLGQIIERLTGITYDEYIERNIFKPSLMHNTGNFDLDHPISNAAEGYTASEIYPGSFKKNIHTLPAKGNAAGGGYTTLSDLYNFTLALKSNKLLNEEFTALFTNPVSQGNTYGLGMQFPEPASGTIYGHSGGHFGVGVEWKVFEKENYTIILLTNKDADNGFLEARYFIQQTISGATPAIEKYFNTKRVLDIYSSNGLTAALQEIRKNENALSEHTFMMKGYDAIKIRDYGSAISLFKLAIEAFPGSSDMYYSLAEAYRLNKEIKLAISNFEKSLELNEHNEYARDKLKQLRANH